VLYDYRDYPSSYNGIRFVNITAPTELDEQEVETVFPRSTQRRAYKDYLKQFFPKAKRPIKKRKASKVGKAKQAKGKARSSKRPNA
jgi:hypothetical protein